MPSRRNRSVALQSISQTLPPIDLHTPVAQDKLTVAVQIAQNARNQQIREERKAITGGKTIKYTADFLLKFAQVCVLLASGMESLRNE